MRELEERLSALGIGSWGLNVDEDTILVESERMGEEGASVSHDGGGSEAASSVVSGSRVSESETDLMSRSEEERDTKSGGTMGPWSSLLSIE